MRLLLVEDDDRSASYLLRGLTESGHIVDRVADGPTGLALALEGIYDVVLLDRRLPGLDGLEVVRQLRAGRCTVPVLMLSAAAGMLDRVEGIRAGCDDYLPKPYAFAELLARLDMLLRRRDRSRPLARLEVDDLVLDLASRRVTRGGGEIRLQHRETLLLEVLMRHSGQVVSRAMLLEAAWDYRFEPRGNIVDMHIHRLRQKIERGGGKRVIQTVPGAGYMLRGT